MAAPFASGTCGAQDKSAVQQPEQSKVVQPDQASTGKAQPQTPFNQAMVFYHEREFPKALEAFKQAAEQGGPDAAASYAWLSRSQLATRKPEEAAISADKSIQLDRTLPTAISALGEVYYRQGRLLEAQDLFRKVVLADKPDARAYLGLAKIHWATGNYKSAKQVIDHAYKLDPQDPEVFWRWLTTLDDAEQISALKAQVELTVDPDSRQAKSLKSAIQAREERAKRPPSACRLVSAAKSTEIKLEMLLRGRIVLAVMPSQSK